MLTCRPLSLRAFGANDWLVAAELATGEETSDVIRSIFDDTEVEYIQLHTAKLGCYLAGVTRA